jgi:hypothetical protein
MTAPPLRNARRRCRRLLAPDGRGRCETHRAGRRSQSWATLGPHRRATSDRLLLGQPEAPKRVARKGRNLARRNRTRRVQSLKWCLLRGLSGLIELRRTIDLKYRPAFERLGGLGRLSGRPFVQCNSLRA